MKRIAVQIVLYNSAPTIIGCLESLVTQELFGRELLVFVLDNSSADDSASRVEQWIRENHRQQQVSFERSSTNLGFSGGHNTLLERSLKAGASAVLVLNPDVFLTPGSLEQLVRGLEFDERAGLCTPKLYRADAQLRLALPRRIDAAGMVMTPEMRHFDRGSESLDIGRYQYAEYVFGGTGAALLIRRKCIREVSWFFPGIEMFDEAFFAYREDADLAWRALRCGWRCRYEPTSEMYHVRVVTPARRHLLPPELNRMSVRNRFLLQFNNASLGANIAHLLPTLWRNLVVIGGTILKERSSIPGLVDAVRLFPRALERRRRIFAQARLPESSLRRWFKRLPYAEPALNLPAPTSHPIRREINRFIIVVVNYTSGNRLRRCLENLTQVLAEIETRAPGRVKAVVIDNASTDESFLEVTKLETLHPSIELLSSVENLGFAGGIEYALRGREWDGLLTLNPDAFPTTAAILALIEALEEFRDLGAVGANLINEDGSPQVGFSARRFPTVPSTLIELLGLHQLFPGNFITSGAQMLDDPLLHQYLLLDETGGEPPIPSPDVPYVVEQPAGACLAIAWDAYTAAGGFDITYWPAWFEDVDLCQKLRRRGFRTAVLSRARVVHEGGYSKTAIGSAEFYRTWYINLRRYWRKHGTPIQRIIIAAGLFVALPLRFAASWAAFFLGRITRGEAIQASNGYTDALKDMLFRRTDRVDRHALRQPSDHVVPRDEIK